MPKLKVLSGAEVVRILSIFGFKVASQRGSHIKLRRIQAGGGQQTLTIPNAAATLTRLGEAEGRLS